jgi:glycosyltransferase involved in cell wall biosynthesis
MTEPIRVLQVLARLNIGGAETMVMNLYRHINRDKVQFDFIISTEEPCDFTDEVKALGGSIYTVPRFSLTNALRFCRAWHQFFKTQNKEQTYKVIHGHVRSTAAIYLSIAKKYGLFTIAHSHSTSSGTGFSALVKNTLQYPIRIIADVLFACSEGSGIWLYGKKAVKKSNFFVLNNAIDAKAFAFDEARRNEMKRSLHIEDRFVIGHTGSFKAVKNHAFMLDVFREVQKKYNRAVLLLVGDGELRPDIEKKAREAGLEDSVIFTGLHSDVSGFLQAMDVFLFPSLWEGLPLAVIEAQASGLPCIISDTVSKEASVTELAEYYPLTDSAEKWAERILRYSGGYDRKNTYEDIVRANYDIAAAAVWLEEFYTEKQRQQIVKNLERTNEWKQKQGN